ncbi:Hypothetical predicted protein [Pelobates cultripes]|uniref:Uncharacterized protein n=1 Tax=Pelobates cultripes TaxID=61616 RepID=A0AAD1RU84_PELCU|nr:Hypothetical predicted protein [Pelobates cultripes]
MSHYNAKKAATKAEKINFFGHKTPAAPLGPMSSPQDGDGDGDGDSDSSALTPTAEQPILSTSDKIIKDFLTQALDALTNKLTSNLLRMLSERTCKNWTPAQHMWNKKLSNMLLPTTTWLWKARLGFWKLRWRTLKTEATEITLDFGVYQSLSCRTIYRPTQEDS